VSVARTRTKTILLATALAVMVATIGPPARAGSRPPRKDGTKKIDFTKPVGLGSSAPLRTVIGTVYSATRGGGESDHEWSGEPSLKVDDDGTIYIAGTCCVVASSPVWRSTNNGRSFEELESPQHIREYGIGAEGDLAVDNKGRVFFIDTYIAGLLMSAWKDNGATWEYTVQPAGPIPGFDDRPWLTISDKALYLYINHVTHTEVYRSTDGGKTWTTGGPLTYKGNALGQPFFPGHISAHRKSDTLWVAGVVDDGGQKLGAAVSTDGGATFREAEISKPQREDFSPIFTGATAVDEANNGYATWSTTDNEGCDVYYAASTNKGKSWQEPVRVNDVGGCATFPWIAARDKGEVALAWYETPKVRRTASATVASVMRSTVEIYGIDVDLTYQDEVPAKQPWHLHVALVKKAHSKNPVIVEERVPHKTPVLTGPLNRELWDFLQLDIDKEGQVHVAYVDKYKDSAPQTWYVGTKTKL
jgi:hypothetical protein